MVCERAVPKLSTAARDEVVPLLEARAAAFASNEPEDVAGLVRTNNIFLEAAGSTSNIHQIGLARSALHCRARYGCNPRGGNRQDWWTLESPRTWCSLAIRTSRVNGFDRNGTPGSRTPFGDPPISG